MLTYCFPGNNYARSPGYAQNLKKYFLILLFLAVSVSLMSLTVSEISKSVNNSNMAFRPATANPLVGSGIGEIRTNLYLVENDDSTVLADGVLAEFNNIFSLQVDRNDALKFVNVGENFAIQRYTYALTAERRPELSVDDTIFYSLSRMVQRNYQFEFEITGFTQTTLIGLLEDSYLHTSTPMPLTGTTIINFSVNADPASSAAGRFRMIFKSIAVLPVTITSLTAYEKNTNIAVEWNVENELNILKYDVEKSIDGSVFTKVNTVKVSGNDDTFNSYIWLDVNGVQGSKFYRIKIYNKNGETKYSTIVKIATGKTESGFSLYPNPVKGSVINLRINNQPAGNYLVRLINLAGQTIYTKKIKISGGSSVESLKMGSRLPAGNYQLEIIGKDNNHNTQKVIVE